MLALMQILPQAYELRNAGAVIHSHSLNAVMATMLDPTSSEFVITHVEMIKVSTRVCPACHCTCKMQW